YAFFFQAEDGIRDGHVTGVQTCALPILQYGQHVSLFGLQTTNTIGYIDASPDRHHHPLGHPVCPSPGGPPAAAQPQPETAGKARSEERRVGKKWRSRRAAGHRKKKMKRQ